jgi:hypothetical protein
MGDTGGIGDTTNSQLGLLHGSTTSMVGVTVGLGLLVLHTYTRIKRQTI